MEVFIGTIQAFGFNFAPRGWAFCAGQVVSISQNSAMFALLGTTFGGDGQSTFGLPDLRGRLPVGMGNGPGLSPYVIGQVGGTENTSLTVGNLPAHAPAITSTLAVATSVQLAAVASSPSTAPSASNAFLGASGTGPGSAAIYSNAQGDSPVALQGVSSSLSGSVSAAPIGGNLPFSLLNPSLAINFSIAMDGIFPSRN